MITISNQNAPRVLKLRATKTEVVVKGRKLREPEGKTRWLTRDEVACLIEAARQTDQPALPDWILVAVHTGLRAGARISGTKKPPARAVSLPACAGTQQ